MNDMNEDIAAGLSEMAELALLLAIAAIEFTVGCGFAVAVGVWALVFMGA